MKLGKTSWIMLTIGVFAVAFVSLGVARSQQVSERNELGEQLSVAEARLDKVQLKELYARNEEFKEQLNQAVSQLEAAEDDLRQSIESIEVTDSVFEIAEACGVEITSLSSPGVSTDELEDLACGVIQLSIVVEGEASSLIDFIIKLNGDFTTGVVKSANISIPGTVDEGSSSANIKLVIYSYQDV